MSCTAYSIIAGESGRRDQSAFWLPLVERDAAKLFHQRAVTERLQPEQLRGQHGVENGLRLGRAGAAQHAQVEIGPVQNPGVAAGRRPKFLERKSIERIDEKMLARHG